jgi:hypothetical protein
MSHNITETPAWTTPVTVLGDGDPVDNAHTEPTIQALANRTAYAKAFLDLLGALAAPVQVTAGRLYLALKGTTDAGVLEVLTGASDVDNRLIGMVQFTDILSGAADKAIARIKGRLNGSTLGNRGGKVVVEVKSDGNNTHADIVTVHKDGVDVTGAIGATGGITAGATVAGVDGSFSGHIVAQSYVQGLSNKLIDDAWINCTGAGVSAPTSNANFGINPVAPSTGLRLRFAFTNTRPNANYAFSIAPEMPTNLGPAENVYGFILTEKTTTHIEFRWVAFTDFAGGFADLDTTGTKFNLFVRG